MSNRTKWTDFDKETRKYIKKRDHTKCVVCGSNYGLQIMHIFVNRSHGGKGCKENGCLGCIKCHNLLDNPIGKSNIEKAKQIEEYCKKYLIDKENIIYNDDFINHLKYQKQYDIIVEKNKEGTKTNRCGECKYLIKQTNKRNTLPIYYCKLTKKVRAKKGEVCDNFKNNL